MTRSAPGTAKTAIVGAGHVGVTLAYACLIRGTGKTIALFGRHAQQVRADVLDLQHGQPTSASRSTSPRPRPAQPRLA